VRHIDIAFLNKSPMHAITQLRSSKSPDAPVIQV
jgi:hypothetical protein